MNQEHKEYWKSAKKEILDTLAIIGLAIAGIFAIWVFVTLSKI